MALALNNLKRVYMPLNKETNQLKIHNSYKNLKNFSSIAKMLSFLFFLHKHKTDNNDLKWNAFNVKRPQRIFYFFH